MRTDYLASLVVLRPLVEAAAPDWQSPSALAEMTVGDLAGHAARAAFTVEGYLSASPPTAGEALDAPGYFLALPELAAGIDADFHAAIRERAGVEAAAGPAALLDRFDAALASLGSTLPEQPPDRPVSVLDGLLLPLDEYLVTRLVEIVVHGDDLAASLAVPSPDFSPAAVQSVISCLVDVAARRHGDMAVIRALTRRERDVVEALRVL